MAEEEKGFVVKDRRIFTDEDKKAGANDEKTQTHLSTDGEPKSPPVTGKTPEPEPPEPEPPEPETPEPETPEPSKTDASGEETPFPKINFPTFVVSLNASALLHLGAIEDPTTGRKTKNLPMAKQTIDILSMLEEKTTGNLNNEEKNLLKNILYDLRLMYVKEKG